METSQDKKKVKTLPYKNKIADTWQNLNHRPDPRNQTIFRKEIFHKNTIERKPKKARADVLLVYPIWVEKRGRGKLQRMLPPLGILSIASFLEQFGYEVHVVDLHAEEICPEEFRKIVRSLNPKFVGITVLSAHVTPAHHIAKICKEEIPEGKVFVGGVHAEAAPEEMLQNPFIDAVCRGDGEEVMLELVRGDSFESIAGLSYRKNREIVHNAVRELNTDLDAYPFPAYHLIDLDNYFPPVGSYRDLPAVNLLMTRGCPGSCTFCNSANTKLRGRSVEKMVELIEHLRYQYGIRQFYFYDDTFTANPLVVKRFCELMIEKKVDAHWICYARGDMFRESLAELMAKAGCHQVLLGVESGSSSLMAKIGKPIKKEKYLEVVKTAHKFGIEVRGSFIIGHPFETLQTMEETVNFAKEMDLDFFQLNIMTPYPGTQLFREAKRKGQLVHENYARYGQSEVILKPEFLSAEEILGFEKRAFLKFYLRPRAIFLQLKRLTNFAQLKDLFKAAYVIFISGIGIQSSRRSERLQKWLEIDTDSFFDKTVQLPNVPNLTFEVRQNRDFLATNHISSTHSPHS